MNIKTKHNTGGVKRDNYDLHMSYAQIKSGQKLHLVYNLPKDCLTQPVCGIKTEDYRMTASLPRGSTCKNCLRVLNNNGHDPMVFLSTYFKH